MVLARTVADGCERLRSRTQRRANTPSTPRPPEWNGNPCYAFGKQNLCWTGHFIPPPNRESPSPQRIYTPPPTENASIKWPVQVKPLKKENLCWTGRFIPPPPTENASIKWPVQVKPLKKHIFTWNGHFIPQPVGSRTLTRKRKDSTRYRGKTTTERYNGKATTRKWDMSRLYTFIVFNVSYRLAMIGILNML